MIGKTISHYKILEKLGEGGMGVVYKAEDTRLRRPVALKFLLPELTRDPQAKERFINEARAASALDHPNICTIYEIAETDEGQLLIAMAFYDGESLKAKISRGPLDVGEATGIAAQIAAGLARAHSRGIIHRDVKPANIIVTTDGIAKIIDFGLAMLAGGARLTRTGRTTGTAAYMSPEQARGGDLDLRTDVWSFGVVLYEMLTGRLPFRCEYEIALIYSILNDEPKPVTSLRDAVPPGLERVVDKALAKRPSERYQSVAEMSADVCAASEELSGARAAPGQGRREETGAGPRKKSIAVLPFRSLSDSKEDEYFSDGTTEDIITQLSKVRELKVISRTSIMRYKHTDKSIPEIGRELGVATILEGSVRRAGGRVRIVAQLLDVQTDEHMWAETYDRSMEDVFAIQSDVAEKIAAALRTELSPVEKERIGRKPTESMEAYNLYLKGRFYWNKRRPDDLKVAVDYFNKAIETDPRYALAYAGLASAYVILPGYTGVAPTKFMPKAEAAARRALELDPTLGEAHAVLGQIKMMYEWDWAGGESEFKKAIELNPSYPTAHHWYCLGLSVVGRYDEAWVEIRRAQELDPLSLVISSCLGGGFYYERQFDKALDQFKKTLELDPNFAPAHLDVGLACLALGRSDEAIAEFQKVRELVGSGPYGLAGLGYAYAQIGRKSEAEQILRELLQFLEQGYAVSYDIAGVYLGLKDKDKALDWLEKAYEERSIDRFAYMHPVWDELHSDPRFTAIMRKMGLET